MRPIRTLFFAAVIFIGASSALVAEPAGGQSRSAKTAPAKSAGVKEIDWEQLVPPDFRPDELIRDYVERAAGLDDADPRAQELADKLREHWERAPVVRSLDNETVKLSGFLVTLEGDGKAVSEFLLVPYFGACIHVPPPPSNQIVLVRTGAKPYKVDQVFDMVSVTGRLKTEFSRSELASASYVIEASNVERYTE